MITGNKLHRFLERCERDRKPITAEIFLTDYCNLRCSYCRYNHKDGKWIDYRDFVTYATRLVEMGVKGIILTGGGEPTLNPHFEKITQWLERNEIPYGINTNGIKPIMCRANFVKVSLDTGNSERYKEIRGRDKMEHVINNIADMVHWRDNGHEGTRIGVQCVATDRDDVISFYERVKYLGVDYIYLRPLEGLNVKKTSEEDVRKWLGDEAMKDERIVLSFKFGLLGYEAPFCLSNWSVITVDTGGNVPYCCHRPDDIVGNIMDLNILQKKMQYHVDMKKCEKPCRLSGANKYLEEYKRDKECYFV